MRRSRNAGAGMAEAEGPTEAVADFTAAGVVARFTAVAVGSAAAEERFVEGPAEDVHLAAAEDLAAGRLAVDLHNVADLRSAALPERVAALAAGHLVGDLRNADLVVDARAWAAGLEARAAVRVLREQ